MPSWSSWRSSTTDKLHSPTDLFQTNPELKRISQLVAFLTQTRSLGDPLSRSAGGVQTQAKHRCLCREEHASRVLERPSITSSFLGSLAVFPLSAKVWRIFYSPCSCPRPWHANMPVSLPGCGLRALRWCLCAAQSRGSSWQHQISCNMLLQISSRTHR